MLNNLIDPMYMILGLVVLLIVVVMAYLLFHVTPVMPYLYLSAIIQSRSSKMLTTTKMRQLSECSSYHELSGMLTDTIFATDGCEVNTISQLHRFFEDQFIKAIDEIVSLSPNAMQALMNKYLMFYEVGIVKMLYKSKKYGVRIDKELSYPVGILSKELLTRLESCEDLNEFANYFRDTVYFEPLKKEYELTEEIDFALDNAVIMEIGEFTKNLKVHDKKKVMKLMDMIIDIKNIETKIQSIIRSTDLSLFNGGSLDQNQLKAVKDMGQFIEYLQKTEYAELATEAGDSYNTTKSPSVFEVNLNRHLKKFIGDNMLLNPQGAFSVFAYLILLEIEKKNLFTLTKGVASEFPSAQIVEMII